MKTWAARNNKGQYYPNDPTVSSLDGKDTIGVALTLSRRMVSILKQKRIINIEAHFQMIALGLTICSEVCFFNLFHIY